MTIRVLAGRTLSASQAAMLQAAADIELIQVDAQSGDDIAQALTPETEVLFTWRGDISITHAAGLRWVQTENAGVDHLVDSAIWRSDVTLTSANGAHIPHLPAFVMAHMLSWAYKLPLAREYQSQTLWGDGEYRASLTPRELHGQTLGIVGYGAVGRELARLARGFGMRVLATRRTEESSLRYSGYSPPGTGDPDGMLPERFFTLAQLDELLQQSDFLVLVVPLADGTRQLIGARELAQMRPGALLLNIGRGALIDQLALVDALERGVIAGAMVDVTDPEPLPSDHPLWRAPNLTLTPHVGGLSRHYSDNVVRVFAENLRRYAGGQPLLNIVQRDLGY
jgi:phosphoglycerate dehydrogenase-like enzyme